MSIIQASGSGDEASGFYPHTINNSLRFNAGDDPFLSRTPSAASNRKTWTWSAWVKRATIDNTVRELFGTAAEGDVLRFTDSRIGWFNNGSASSFLSTSAFFRDPSAWYNIVLAFDTTESTDSDRVKLYVNGTQVAFDNNTTFPGPSYEGDINNTEAQFIGKGHSASEFDGYLAEINFIDGQALGPSSFGETKNDIWVASSLGSFTAATTTVSSAFSSGASSITVSSATGIAIGQQVEGTGIASSTFVTGVSSTTISLSQNTDGSSSGNYTFGNYGRNGFRLQFAQTGTGTGSSSTVGADTSGNGNHFTSSGLASTDQMLDSPTNNFATLGAQQIVTHTLSDGNLKSTNSSGTHGGTTATFNYPTSGKWYHEVTINAEDSSGGNGVGIGNQIGRTSTNWGNYLNLVAYLSNGNKQIDTGATSYGTGQNANNIVGVAFDADNQTLEFYLATSAGQTASSQGTIPTSELDGVLDFNNLCPLVFGRNTEQTFNFGQSAFNGTDGSGTLPTGFKALNTANLPDPAIDPAEDETPDQYFDTTTYTANNGTLTVTGLEFQPDFVWIKSRTLDIAHAMFDVIRGTATAGSTNTALGFNRVDTQGNGNGVLSAFTSDGFTVAGGSSGSNPRSLVNKGTNTYVAWTWRAGGTASANNDGSQEVQLSVNTKAKFSIAKFTGTQQVNAPTFGHGLGVTPELIIIKGITEAQGWYVFGDVIGASGSGNFLKGETNAARVTGSASSNVTFNATTIGLDSNTGINASSDTFICYSFASVDGYSKIGEWQNNNSTDGTFVFTGFRPAWILLKNYDNSEGWYLMDNKRSPFNIGPPLGQFLGGNLSVVEGNVNASTATIDFLSNGFKIRTTSAGSGEVSFGTRNYLYLAFADQPFKYSNAR